MPLKEALSLRLKHNPQLKAERRNLRRFLRPHSGLLVSKTPGGVPPRHYVSFNTDTDSVGADSDDDVIIDIGTRSESGVSETTDIDGYSEDEYSIPSFSDDDVPYMDHYDGDSVLTSNPKKKRRSSPALGRECLNLIKEKCGFMPTPTKYVLDVLKVPRYLTRIPIAKLSEVNSIKLMISRLIWMKMLLKHPVGFHPLPTADKLLGLLRSLATELSPIFTSTS